MLRHLFPVMALFASVTVAAASGVAVGGAQAPDSAAVAAGAKLFGQYCQTCHGKTGRGDGPGAASLKPKPRNLTDPKQLKSKNDADLVKVISKGGPALGLSPAMVGWGPVLKEPQIRQVIAFIRSQSAAPGTGPAAKSGAQVK